MALPTPRNMIVSDSSYSTDESWSIMSDGILLVAHLLKYVTEVLLVSISTSLYFKYSYYPCTPYHLITLI